MTDIGEEPVAQPVEADGDPQTPGPSAPSVTEAVPPKCPTRTRIYRAGHVLDEGFPAEQISERLAADPKAIAWLDLYDPTPDDLRIVVDEFGLHPLAVEDAISPRQRAKVDRYRTHLFANMYAVSFGDRLVVGEISMFVTERALITVRKQDFDIDALIARWDLNTDLVNAENQVSLLVYGLVVDGHYEAVEQLDDAIDDLQSHLFTAEAGSDLRRQAYDLGGSIAALRRLVAPMQEVVNRLAAWAAIIAVPTAVTGFYGQNVPYPGFGHHDGFLVSCVVMIVLAGALFLYLRKQRWL